MHSTPARPGLRSMDEALAELLASVVPLQALETVSTFEADGRVLAQDLISELDVPGFDNSQMDGYALRSSDVLAAGTALPVSQRIPAGHFGQALQPSTCARIFTGAPMPPGADCVVPQEETALLLDGCVQFNVLPKAGQWVRLRGEDVMRGAVALQAGQKLSPAALGLAASLGLAQLRVTRKPRVALFSTGDELVMPGEVAPTDMKPGAIYNSNRFFLRSLLLRAGCDVTDLGIVPDQREATVGALHSAAQTHDLIVTSGGVSVGEEDHIKPAVEQLGRLNLWSISMKPGKPFAYGRVNRVKDGAAGTQASNFCHFVGLPGNPVSSFVTFVLLVRPMLAQLQGQGGDLAALPSVQMRADFSTSKADKRREFMRVRCNAQAGLDLFPNQNSSVLTSCLWADGLIDVPAGTIIERGDRVRYIALSQLL
jgi:molybdopterin molybdotransferase